MHQTMVPMNIQVTLWAKHSITSQTGVKDVLLIQRFSYWTKYAVLARRWIIAFTIAIIGFCFIISMYNYLMHRKNSVFTVRSLTKVTKVRLWFTLSVELMLFQRLSRKKCLFTNFATIRLVFILNLKSYNWYSNVYCSTKKP